jgi:hypothetical protein
MALDPREVQCMPARVLDGHSLGDNASHGFAFDRMGSRITRSVTGRIPLRTMAGRLATLAEAPDQGPGTHIANFYQPRLQLVTLELQNFELRRVRHGAPPLWQHCTLSENEAQPLF